MLCCVLSFLFFFFFFQAEDGIRDHCVTGVQTCALPIPPVIVDSQGTLANRPMNRYAVLAKYLDEHYCAAGEQQGLKVYLRSEERRVGKECRSRWSADH